jgi:hypothetical protein
MNAPFLTRPDAASWLQERLSIPVSVHAMAHFAAKGTGPIYRRIDGRTTVYNVSDLETWAAQRLVRNATRNVSKTLGRPRGTRRRAMPNERSVPQQAGA